MQDFMIEMGSYDFLEEIHSTEKHQRDATLEYGRKCIDFVLATDDILRCTIVIELMECDNIVESDHRGNLINVDMEDCFA